jgi:tripartite-type tricarboxylate transporter receptor subunit TctC
MKFKSVLVLAAAFCVTHMAPLYAQTEPYPSKPIRLIVPFPPGGGSDPVARVIAKGLSERLGQQVLVDNRPGAQGAVGSAFAAKSPADGYTLLLFVGALVADPWVRKNQLYDPVKDFSFITQVTHQPSLAVVGTHISAVNLKEFIALAKAKPDTLTFGYGSVSGQLTGALLAQLTGIKIVPVPYKGAAPIMTDLVGGVIDLAFASPPSSIPLVKAGKLQGLTVVGPRRLAGLPEVGTSAESGVPEFVVDAWYAIAAPANTPPAVVAKLNAEIRQVIQSPAAQEILTAAGMEGRVNSPQEITKYVASEYLRWGAIVKAAGIKPE